MLDRLAHVGVAGDAKSPEQTNAETRGLAEVMADAGADGNDTAHALIASVNFRRTRA
jgi:hypothetical protein